MQVEFWKSVLRPYDLQVSPMMRNVHSKLGISKDDIFQVRRNKIEKQMQQVVSDLWCMQITDANWASIFRLDAQLLRPIPLVFDGKVFLFISIRHALCAMEQQDVDPNDYVEEEPEGVDLTTLGDPEERVKMFSLEGPLNPCNPDIWESVFGKANAAKEAAKRHKAAFEVSIYN